MVVGDDRTQWLDAMTLYGHWETWHATSQARTAPGLLAWPASKGTDKNIKLHIVTDIKVNFNSMLGFRISNLVGGKGTFTKQ